MHRPHAALPLARPSSATQVEHLSALGAALADPACQLAICHRHADPELGAITTLAFTALASIDTILPVAGLDIALSSALADAGYPAPLGGALSRDITDLARLHAAIRGVAAVRVRLDWIVGDACRRFHMDYVTTRLLVTYRGAGTQWIEAARPDRIRQLPGNAVALLKGRLLVAEPTILHRSPPVADDGDARLLLVVDPVLSGD